MPLNTDKDFHVRAEVLLEFADRRLGVGVVAIAHSVPDIRPGNCLQDIGMDTGVVVAGEAAGRFHGTNNVAEAARPEGDNFLLSFRV